MPGGDMKKASLSHDKKTIIVMFRFTYGSTEFSKTLKDIKTLPGRKFNSSRKVWEVPFKKHSAKKLIEWGFSVDDHLQEKTNEIEQRAPGKEIKVKLKNELRLRPFQEEGVWFTESKDGNVLIADEMGLGKTVQALTWLEYRKDLRPALIVCPASLKLNWLNEAIKWTTIEDIRILSGNDNEADDISPDGITIVNYDVLQGNHELLSKTKHKAIILDECHYIKNSKAKRTKYAKKIAKEIPHKIGLSGTPIVNKPIEFFTILNLLQPDTWSSHWQYAQRYCGASHNGFGWDFSGASNIEELHGILTDTVMIRRTKKEVLTDLPEKERTVIPLEIDNRQEYQKASDDLIGWIIENEGKEKAKKAEGAQILVQFEKLKQLAVQGKLKQAISWIRDVLEEKEKLVVFCTHHETIDAIIGEFKEVAVKLDGRDSLEKKQEAVDSFQNDKSTKLFVGNIKAAGTGITLTAADTAAFIEFGWSPGEHNQAEDRIHRIGQKNAANIYYLLATKTIEMEIAGILDDKRIVLERVLDGKEAESNSLLIELTRKYYGNNIPDELNNPVRFKGDPEINI